MAPFWFSDTLTNTIGHREAEKALMLGKMYTPQQALSVGLIDAVVPQDQVVSAVEEEMKVWLKIPGK